MKKIIALSLCLWGSFSAAKDLPYLDPDFLCIDTDTANRYVSDFNIDVDSFGGREFCRSEVDTKKLLDDIAIIEQGRFEGSTSNPLIGGFVPATDYYAWMKSQTSGMKRGNDIPYATAYNSYGYFTMQDGWAQLSTLGRVGTIIHEARHTEGYRHVICTQGPYRDSGVSGCDSNYTYGGSHAVEMEYYARVSVQGKNFHPVYKSMARLMAVARANFTFNTPVLKAREAIMAIDRNTHEAVLFADGKRNIRDRSAHDGALKRSSAGAVLFDGISASVIELYQRVADAPTLRDVYSYFKLTNPAAPVHWTDLEEYDVNGKRFVVGLKTSETFATYQFPLGKWGNDTAVGFPVQKTVTTLPDGQRGYFLIDQNLLIHPFIADRGVQAPLAQTWPEDLNQVALDQNRPLRLFRDGKIRNADGSLWVAGAAHEWSSIVNVPLYNSFEVVP